MASHPQPILINSMFTYLLRIVHHVYFCIVVVRVGKQINKQICDTARHYSLLIVDARKVMLRGILKRSLK